MSPPSRLTEENLTVSGVLRLEQAVQCRAMRVWQLGRKCSDLGGWEKSGIPYAITDMFRRTDKFLMQPSKMPRQGKSDYLYFFFLGGLVLSERKRPALMEAQFPKGHYVRLDTARRAKSPPGMMPWARKLLVHFDQEGSALGILVAH